MHFPSDRCSVLPYRQSKMDVEQFRYWGKQVIDYICTYVTTVGDRRVTADVEPGFLNDLIPSGLGLYLDRFRIVLIDSF